MTVHKCQSDNCQTAILAAILLFLVTPNLLIYNDHVNTDMPFEKFKQLCAHCWTNDKYGFVMDATDKGLTPLYNSDDPYTFTSSYTL